ncbi:hypothetical protein [Stygiolobus caldivivus]|uniref:Uncharacterized protein n=1 Tax=Stygiolobus caldivivus TaxID=2824673 RepID=A0A8D5ZCY8_9CREN|nr:hypothetical protein [Stygiolobus caldivivus]BCU68818.1 hypothetical protein KN1_01150 [Stygiolobus caldivivus]
MGGEIHQLVEIYLFYIATMTVLISYLLYLSLIKREEKAYLFLEVSFIMTGIFLIFISNSVLVSLLITVYLWLIPRLLHSSGKIALASITSTISHEIIMSLIYYAIVRGGLLNALYSLYFYATDIPSFSLSLYSIIVPSVLEIVNSFMFFLMILPEIIFVCAKTRNYYALGISLLALSGPNIASEMTHSILPLQEDPIKQASLLALLISVVLQLTFSVQYIKNKIDTYYFSSFLIASSLLSISELYYSITLNEVPYAITTLVGLFVSLLLIAKPVQVNVRTVGLPLVLASALPNLFWGASVALFYNLYQFVFPFSVLPFVLGMSPFFYVKFNNLTKN